MGQGRHRTFRSVAEYAATRDALIGVVPPTRVVELLGTVLRLEATPPPMPAPSEVTP